MIYLLCPHCNDTFGLESPWDALGHLVVCWGCDRVSLLRREDDGSGKADWRLEACGKEEET